jgi:hypothetical protein
MNGAPEKGLQLLPVLFLALLAWRADAQQGRLVSACALPGQIFSCRNCTGRFVAALPLLPFLSPADPPR